MPNLDVKVCADRACSSELPRCDAGTEPCYQLSSVGERPFLSMFDVPQGFDGALRFSAPGYTPLDYVLGGTVRGAADAESPPLAVAVEMLSEAATVSLYRELGATADPSRGTLMARVFDCQGLLAADVEIEAVAGNVERSIAYMLTLDNIATVGAATTDRRGVAGFVNLPPDALTIAASASDGHELARATVLVRPNAIALVDLRARQ